MGDDTGKLIWALSGAIIALTVLAIFLLMEVATLHEEMHEVQELLGITHG